MIPLLRLLGLLVAGLILISLGGLFLETHNKRLGAARSQRLALAGGLLEGLRNLLATALVAYAVLIVGLGVSGAFGRDLGADIAAALIARAGAWSDFADGIRLSAALVAVCSAGLLYLALYVWPLISAKRRLEKAAQYLAELNELRSLRDRYLESESESEATGETLRALEARIREIENSLPAEPPLRDRRRLGFRILRALVAVRDSGPAKRTLAAVAGTSLLLFFLSLVVLEPGIIAGSLAWRAIAVSLAQSEAPSPAAIGEHGQLPRRSDAAADSLVDVTARRIALDIRHRIRQDANWARASRQITDNWRGYTPPRPAPGRPPGSPPPGSPPPESPPPDPPYPFGRPDWPRGEGPPNVPPPETPAPAPSLPPRSKLEERVYAELKDHLREHPEAQTLLDYTASEGPIGDKSVVIVEDLFEGGESFAEQLLTRLSGNSLVAKVGSRTLVQAAETWLGDRVTDWLSNSLERAEAKYWEAWEAYVSSRHVIAGKHGCSITERAFQESVDRGELPLRLYTDDVDAQRWLASKGIRGTFAPPLVFRKGQWLNREQRLSGDDADFFRTFHEPCVIVIP